MRCLIGVPPGGKVCAAVATCKIVWPDGTKTPACSDCASRMRAQGQDAHAKVTIEPLR